MSADGPAPSHVTTHVLDAVTGRPAVGVAVTLEQRVGSGWVMLASGETDAEGRLSTLGPAALPVGCFRIGFDTGAWFARSGRATLYPEVTISFELAHPTEHYHVPLLLSPFAYSTYRGS
jgi:5-hydroxyisourate hydrolase